MLGITIVLRLCLSHIVRRVVYLVSICAFYLAMNIFGPHLLLFMTTVTPFERLSLVI